MDLALREVKAAVGQRKRDDIRTSAALQLPAEMLKQVKEYCPGTNSRFLCIERRSLWLGFELDFVFVLCPIGSREEQMFLMGRFPQLQDRHFANYRDISFEEHILRETNGQGDNSSHHCAYLYLLWLTT